MVSLEMDFNGSLEHEIVRLKIATSNKDPKHKFLFFIILKIFILDKITARGFSSFCKQENGQKKKGYG
jgi:hypothetical protein